MMMFTRSLALLVAVSFAACGGGSSSPTAPTPAPSATLTKIIALSGSLAFGDVVVGTTSELTITVSNTGTGPLTVTGVTAPASSASLFSATIASSSVAPGGSTTIRVRFTPASTGPVSGTATVTADHTSGTNTIAFSGAGVGALVTVVGVVTDAATRAPIGSVRVLAQTTSGAIVTLGTATTDGNGFYSFVLPSATAINLNYAVTGYNQQNAAVTLTGDTRRDVTLTRATPAAAALEYRVSGTGSATSAGLTYSNCTSGTSQQGDAQLPWSFTCSSIPTGQFLYISAQNNRSTGCVKVQIYKRGTFYRESESCGAYVIATASGSY